MGSSGGWKDKITKLGLTEVYTANEPLVDVVFVHGLNGDPYNTWAFKKESWHSRKPEVFWPADLLPSALESQRARILTYGYDANITAFTDGASKDKIHNHAEHLTARLSANRSLKKATERPIIWVAHSLGGLVVKRTLIYCRSVHHQHTERLRSIYVSTYGILFLGTPHNGSDLAKLGTILQSICDAVMPKKFLDTSPNLVKALKTDNETLQNINRLFVDIQSRYHIYYFHESKPMDFKGTRRFVVDEESAAPVMQGVERMGIEADHRNMAKFEDENAPGYDTVAEAIQRYAEESLGIIKVRWTEEKQIRDFERKAEVREMLGGNSASMIDPVEGSTQLTAPSKTPVSLGNSMISSVEVEPELEVVEHGGPLLIAPPGFRPNSLFFGFQIELDQLNQRLSNSKKREMGSVAVLIHGGPGTGKSHLARQHIWLHRDEYAGGVFWVDGKSVQSICQSFWDIAQAAALIEGGDHRDSKWDTADIFVESVRKWFENRDRWLLVFDGISFDREEGLDEFRKFVPDRKSGSIIYTSVDQTLVKTQRLLYPYGVKVRPLSVDDARKLLYKGLGIKRPSEEQEAKATELVKYLECLPLAIHAIAHRLSATGKAIEKYHIGSYSTDKRLAEPYLEIFAELKDYNHLPAVNLINLLAFLGHHVPVAMLQLGRKILQKYDVEIRSADREGSVKRDLETTIGVLIKYGLMERSLYPYPLNERSGTLRSEISFDSAETPGSATSHSRPESSLSSTQSVPTSIDVIRIHTVVQGFCRDELKFKDPEKFYWWLAVAVRTFCESFKVAHARIMAQEGQGLVKDYREFETHAGCLDKHFPSKPDKDTGFLKKARHELQNVTRMIKRQIEHMSPNSSAENMKCQVSIFDRTSSTSSGGPETPTSLTSRSTWTLEDENKKVESPLREDFPASRGAVSLDHRNILSYDTDTDTGYDSGLEEHPLPRVRPPAEFSPSDSEATETEKQPLHHRRTSELLRRMIVNSNQKPENNKDLGEFRPVRPLPPTVTLSHAEANANGTIRSRSNSNSGERPNLTSANSEAKASLAAVHRVSPPGTRTGPVKTAVGAPNASPPPSYARVAGGPPLSSPHLNAVSSHDSLDSLRGRSRNVQPSPLRSESRSGAHTAPGSRSQSRGDHLTSSSGHHSQSPSVSYTFHPQVTIPQDSQLTFEALRSTARPAPIAMTLPTGYTSQPMSRDASKESASSIATEPPRYKPVFSPLPIVPYPISQPHSPAAIARLAGLSFSPHTSPRLRQAEALRPVVSTDPSLWTYNAATGTWSAPVSPVTTITPDQQYQVEAPTAQPMVHSVSSGSGPGILVPNPDGSGSSQIVQFGQQSLVDIDEARRRTNEYARQLELFERGAYRPSRVGAVERPYPMLNRIPSSRGSDATIDGQFEEGGEREGEVKGLGMTFH